jgi:hypothetical protein
MFDHDYCEFQDGELVKVKCQCCGEIIRLMKEVPSQRFPGKFVRELKRLSNFSTRSVDLENNSFANVLICANPDCRLVDLAPNYDKIEAQWERARVQELTATGRSPETIARYKESYKPLRIRRK